MPVIPGIPIILMKVGVVPTFGYFAKLWVVFKAAIAANVAWYKAHPDFLIDSLS